MFSLFLFYSYPEPKQYHKIVTSILKIFPSLIHENSDYGDAHGLWHSRVRSFFKNHRHRDKADLSEVVEKRKIYGKRKGMLVRNDSTSKKVCYGVQNFLPDLPEGEDLYTWEKYQQEMKNQLSLYKEKRNKELPCTLMDKTFPHRRHLIVKEIIRLQDLMEMYPMLCTEDQVVNSVKLVLCYCLFRFYCILFCTRI